MFVIVKKIKFENLILWELLFCYFSLVHMCNKYHIVGIFAGENFHKFSGLGAILERFLLRKFSLSTTVLLSMGMSLSFPTIRESFNRENLNFSNSRNFPPEKDSRYTVYVLCM